MLAFEELLLPRTRALAGATLRNQGSGSQIPLLRLGCSEVTAFTHWMRMAFPLRVYSAWAKLSNSCLGCLKIHLLGTPDLEAANTGESVGYLMKEAAGTRPHSSAGAVRQWELLHPLGLLTLFLAERGAGSSFQRSVKASWFVFTS